MEAVPAPAGVSLIFDPVIACCGAGLESEAQEEAVNPRLTVNAAAMPTLRAFLV